MFFFSQSPPPLIVFCQAPQSDSAVIGEDRLRQSRSPYLLIPRRGLVAGADLYLTGPVPRSESGIPIANGRMGTLLWTSPTTLRMQINRFDVFGTNEDTDSFPQRHTDY